MSLSTRRGYALPCKIVWCGEFEIRLRQGFLPQRSDGRTAGCQAVVDEVAVASAVNLKFLSSRRKSSWEFQIQKPH